MTNKMIKEMEDFLRTAPYNMDTRDMANQLCGYKEGRKQTIVEVEKMIDEEYDEIDINDEYSGKFILTLLTLIKEKIKEKQK